MDASSAVMNRTHDQSAKEKMTAFKFGNVPTQPQEPSSRRSSHTRSHSRTPSVSSISSSLTTSGSATDMPVSKRTSRHSSHHRRQSSVSTRRESAEIMGVSLPDLALSSMEDNVNFGEKDSIRRRALWALEGKPDMTPHSKVEIPDLTTPEADAKPYDFPTKPSFPPGSGLQLGVNAGNFLMGKRDSFGKLLMAPSSSSSDQLGTLVEEDEGEECEDDVEITSPNTPTPVFPATKEQTPSEQSFRHRPKTLNLRPLSLVGAASPSLTPPPRPNGLPTPPPSSQRALLAGLRTLTLSPSPTASIFSFPPSQSSANSMSVTSSTGRQSFSSSPSPARRQSLESNSSVESVPMFESTRSKRQSSILYRRPVDSPGNGAASLPTPDMTPVSERTPSWSALDDDHTIPTGENTFLHHSHAMLLARITDLERALSMQARRNSGRPLSNLSDSSTVSSATSEPSDEMLRLIADLKSERDELKRDVDGWRTRVGDMEKHLSMLTRRVEAERREAWVARERLHMMEVEKASAEHSAEGQEAALQELQEKVKQMQSEQNELYQERLALHAELAQKEAVVSEIEKLKEELEKVRVTNAELMAAMDDVGVLNTPKPHKGPPKKMVFRSLDSVSSLTDVESINEIKPVFQLKAIEEDDEHRFSDMEDDEEDEDELAHYEDDDEEDITFNSQSATSSRDSLLGLDVPESVMSPTGSDDTSSIRAPSPPQSMTTGRKHGSMARTWSFPKGSQTAAVPTPAPVDRFFGCLEDEDEDDLSTADERSENPTPNELFSGDFDLGVDDDDEMPPFVIPAQVGQEMVDEDESDEETYGEAVEGGIRLIVPSFPSMQTKLPSPPVRKPAPVYQPFLEGDEEDSFSSSPVREMLTQISFPSVQTPPRKDKGPMMTTLTTRLSSGGFVTPPLQRITTPPSFIPQPKFTTPPRQDMSSLPRRMVISTYTTPPKNVGNVSFIPQLKPTPLRTLPSLPYPSRPRK